MTSKEIYQLHDKILADIGVLVTTIPTSNKGRYESMMNQYWAASVAIANMARYAAAQEKEKQ